MQNSPFLSSFELLVLSFRDSFSKRSGRYVLALTLAWIMTPGRKTLQKIFQHALMARARSGLYRFFGNFKWDYLQIARAILNLAVLMLGPERVTLVLDDTLSPKSGPKIFGASLHCDHHTSPKTFVWGHNWVMVGLGIRLVKRKRSIVLPLLAELYIREEQAKKAEVEFRTKLQIAVRMIEALTWDLEKPVLVVADGAYTNASVIQPLKERGIRFVGRLRHDAVLYQPLPASGRGKKRRGRRPRWGRRLPKLAKLIRDLTFRKLTVDIYGDTVKLWVAELTTTWPHANGPIKVVVTKKHRRDSEPVYLMSSDPTMSTDDVIVSFAGRWGIEIAFRNAKSELGLGQARVRTRRSVMRVTQFCLWIQSLVILAWLKAKSGARAENVLSINIEQMEVAPFGEMLGELRGQIARERIFKLCGKALGMAKKFVQFVRPLLQAV